ncbi:MAG: MFS transporter [Chroococcidiopsidaceae cyanobacterium CP_BM_RX_35]|nr:MFS transporter [Chroococcidiopsidaceae cyanobacterium CP_BM_RX_35]
MAELTAIRQRAQKSASHPPSDQVTLKSWIAVIGSVVGAFMAILDVSVTNSSLQDIQGALSATLDEGSWISTAYLMTEIVVIPLTGWLQQVFSTRRYLLTNAVQFLFFSMCCAWAWNLPSMVVFRAFQGFTGGVLIPTASSIIVTTLPPALQPIGLSLFSIAATFAPSIGPTIGGWLTVNYGWEYVFYLNLLPGLMLLGAVWYAVEPQPMHLERLKRGDWWGL